MSVKEKSENVQEEKPKGEQEQAQAPVQPQKKADAAPSTGASAAPKKVMSDAQRVAWFKYHEVNETQAALVQKIKGAAQVCMSILSRCIDRSPGVNPSFNQINDAYLAFADAINEAPFCADSAAAIRCLRLSKMAAGNIVGRTKNRSYGSMLNKGNPIQGLGEISDDIRIAYAQVAITNLLSAEMQAISAVTVKEA